MPEDTNNLSEYTIHGLKKKADRLNLDYPAKVTRKELIKLLMASKLNRPLWNFRFTYKTLGVILSLCILIVGVVNIYLNHVEFDPCHQEQEWNEKLSYKVAVLDFYELSFCSKECEVLLISSLKRRLDSIPLPVEVKFIECETERFVTNDQLHNQQLFRRTGADLLISGISENIGDSITLQLTWINGSLNEGVMSLPIQTERVISAASVRDISESTIAKELYDVILWESVYKSMQSNENSVESRNENYELLRQIGPSNMRIFSNVAFTFGLHHILNQDVDSARFYFQLATVRDPYSWYAHELLAKFYILQYEHENAIASYQMYILTMMLEQLSLPKDNDVYFNETYIVPDAETSTTPLDSFRLGLEWLISDLSRSNDGFGFLPAYVHRYTNYLSLDSFRFTEVNTSRIQEVLNALASQKMDGLQMQSVSVAHPNFEMFDVFGPILLTPNPLVINDSFRVFTMRPH